MYFLKLQLKYLNSKNLDVTTNVKDRTNWELDVKSQISYYQLATFLAKPNTQIARNSTSVLFEDNKSVGE